jgi:hypothetical protein
MRPNRDSAILAVDNAAELDFPVAVGSQTLLDPRSKHYLILKLPVSNKEMRGW